MKNLLLLFMTLLYFIACEQQKTDKQKTNDLFNNKVIEMKFGETEYLEETTFGFVLQEIENAGRYMTDDSPFNRMKIKIAGKEYFLYRIDEDLGFSWRLEGKKYQLFINPKSVLEDRFQIKKTEPYGEVVTHD